MASKRAWTNRLSRVRKSSAVPLLTVKLVSVGSALPALTTVSATVVVVAAGSCFPLGSEINDCGPRTRRRNRHAAKPAGGGDQQGNGARLGTAATPAVTAEALAARGRACQRGIEDQRAAAADGE